MKRISLLVVDDEQGVHYGLTRILPPEIAVTSALDAAAAAETLKQFKPDVALLDLRLPDRSGLELIGEIKRVSPRTSIIMMTAFASGQTLMAAMAQGAFDYIAKPFTPEILLGRIEEAASLSRYKRGAVGLGETMGKGETLVGMSPAMAAVYRLIGRLAATDETVLIQGESGTGKELVARALVQHSRRAGQPYLAINCAAFPETLLDAELFGHEKGAFTGATERRCGKFETCDHGTILLDEIGELPLPLQAKLLRVLQEKEVTRLGASRPLKLDLRVLAATNRDLQAEAAAGRFRQDLFYRLAAARIDLPPLRERREDIPELVAHLAKRIWQEQERPGGRTPQFAPTTLKTLAAHDWPGNVRELENVLRQAILAASGDKIRNVMFAPVAANAGADPFAALFRHLMEAQGENLMAAVEERFTRMALERTNGNLTAAARLLGVSRNTLRQREKKT